MINLSMCILIASTTINAPTIVHIEDSRNNIKLRVINPTDIYRCNLAPSKSTRVGGYFIDTTRPLRRFKSE